MHDAHVVALILHLIGLAFGIGGATVADTLFVLAVRHRKLTDSIRWAMQTLSYLIIVGYTLLLVSGVALIATGTDPTARFWAKMVVVAVIGLNAWLAHRHTLPKLFWHITAGKRQVTLGFLQLLSLNAAVSGVSWYSALAIGVWKVAWVPFWGWIAAYVAVLGFALLVSLIAVPKVLRVDDPEFNDVFPVLASSYVKWSPPVVPTEREQV